MDRLAELERKYADLTKALRALLDKAKAENRALSEEDRKEFDRLESEVKSVQASIEEEMRVRALEERAARMGSNPNRANDNDRFIGLSTRETKRFSICRAILAAADGNWKGAEFEKEVSDAVAKRIGRTVRGQGFLTPDSRELEGFMIPGEVSQRWLESVPAEYRDLIKGVASQGGYLVGTELQAASFIELLRNRLILREAGARVLANLVGDILIPKQTGGATGYWVNPDAAAPSESTQTVGQVPLTPKTHGAYTDIGRSLLKQSSIDAENFVREDLVAVVARGVDKAGLHGLGAASEPRGIANVSGIGSVAGGDNGLAPAWSHVINLETEVAQDNADVGRLAYVTNAKVRGKLKQTPRTATYGDIMIWEPGANPTPLNGYRSLVSNQVRSDLTKGSASGVCSAIFFGNWDDLIIAMWGVIDILVDPYTGGTQGMVRVIALQDVDVGVRHPESFSAMLDALTT